MVLKLPKDTKKSKGVKTGTTKQSKASSSSLVPSAKELGDVHVAQSSNVSGEVGNASVDMFIMPYMRDGTVYGDDFDCGDLSVIHVFHKQRPGAFYLIRKAMAKYVDDRHGSDENFPPSLQALETLYSMRIVVTIGQKDDQDCLGFFDYHRVAIYVSSASEHVKNVCTLVDDYLSWRQSFSDEEFEPIRVLPEVHVYSTIDLGLDFTEADDMKCKIEVIKNSPLCDDINVFQASPPSFPKRLVVVNMELNTTNCVDIVFAGNTKPFRTMFEKAQIGGKTIKMKDTDEYGEYFRKKEQIEIDTQEKRADLLELLCITLLKGAPIIVRTIHNVADDAHMIELKKLMSGQPTIRVLT